MITKSQRLKLLLDKWYFPKELPPNFTTKNFAKYRNTIMSHWEQIPVNRQHLKTNYEKYSIPHLNRVRRSLAIVNPVSQLFLSKLICDNYKVIYNHINKSKISIDKAKLEKSDNANFVEETEEAKNSYENFVKHKNYVSASYQYGLAMDYSRFYGTIYTHVIPWAIHGKDWCKINHNSRGNVLLNGIPVLYRDSLGNKLDKAIRNTQDNQSIGLPIGPYTSRIISEIIAVEIDKKVFDKINYGDDQVRRYIDDIYIGCDTSEQAESFITEWAVAAREFEVELNVEKTFYEQVSNKRDSYWANELRKDLEHYMSDEDSLPNSIDLFFLKAFEMHNKMKSVNVLGYAINYSLKKVVGQDNWEKYQIYLYRAIRVSPDVISSVARVLVKYWFDGYEVNRSILKKLLNDILKQSCPLLYYHEIAWSLYLARLLEIEIDETNTKLINALESSVCILLALDLNSANLFEGQIDLTLWENKLNARSLENSLWLLAYESTRLGWLNIRDRTNILNNPYFKVLFDKKISFFNKISTVIEARNENVQRRLIEEFENREIDTRFRNYFEFRQDDYL